MSEVKIPKRISSAVIQSLGAGVVPRIGLEHIAVGRKAEIEVLLHDIDQMVAEGGASFRMILGRYGSGKSFLSQLIRNYAIQRKFVVMDADLSPEIRLTGSTGQGLNLYRQLLSSTATQARPDGGAFSALLERWISDVQQQVMQADNIQPTDPAFATKVEERIRETISEVEGMVHAFDFATVIVSYWYGHQSGDDDKKESAMRWLRGEYSTKTEAREALGVRVIIDDASWYDYIKLLAIFFKDIGYKGLVVFVDEAVNLYKISNTVSRNNNYERLLTIFNDLMQGKAQYLGMVMGATPQMVEDTRRGLYSYEALRTRLEESRFVRDDLRDLSGPIIRLEVLSPEEIFVLLQRIRAIHSVHHSYEPTVTDRHIEYFLNEIRQRLGAEQMLTPREVVRDFSSLLNILRQNPDQTVESIMGGETFEIHRVIDDPEALSAETEIKDDGDDVQPNYKSFEI